MLETPLTNCCLCWCSIGNGEICITTAVHQIVKNQVILYGTRESRDHYPVDILAIISDAGGTKMAVVVYRLDPVRWCL